MGGTAPVGWGNGRDGPLPPAGGEKGSRGRSPGQAGLPGTRAVRMVGIVAVGVAFTRSVGGTVAVVRPPHAPSSPTVSMPHRTMAPQLPGLTRALFKRSPSQSWCPLAYGHRYDTGLCKERAGGVVAPSITHYGGELYRAGWGRWFGESGMRYAASCEHQGLSMR